MLTRLAFHVCLAVAVSLVVAGQGRTQPVTLSAPTAQAAAGQEVEIPISFKGPSGIGALHLELAYDPAILESKTVEKGPALNGNSLIEFNNAQPGRLIIGAVSLDGVQGEGILLKARFTVRGQTGQKSSLRLDNVQAWDGKTHLDALTKTESGEFTVTAAGGTFNSLPWVVGIGAGALLLFMTFVAFRSRQAQRHV